MADIYKKQWESEIRKFLRGLENGNYIQTENNLAVLYSHENEDTDPRYIVYEFGANKLRDDHFCSQHSRVLKKSEMKKIFAKCEQLGIDPSNWDIYDCYQA